MKNWLLGILSLAILGMIYWSFLLIEHDLKDIREQIGDLKQSLENHNFRAVAENSVKGPLARPHIKEESPNLLIPDPYYEKTLPDLMQSAFHGTFKPSGTLKSAILGKPENFHPFGGFKDINKLKNMCSLTLGDYHVGKYEIFAPSAAIKIEARSPCEFWVHLREGLTWQPLRKEFFPNLTLAPHFLKKHPVTAHDFKFFYDAIMNPYLSEGLAAALRTYFNEVESVEVIDDLTFVIRWKPHLIAGVPKIKYAAFITTVGFQPLPCFLYQYFSDGQKIVEEEHEETYRTNSIWAQNFSNHFAKNIIASCGAWTFDGFSDDGIRLKRNPSFFEPLAALTEGFACQFKQTTEAIWQDFKVGFSDTCLLTPTQKPELKKFLESDTYLDQKQAGDVIEQLDYVEPSFFYIGWNEITPYFCSKKARQAMTLSIDRKRIIAQNLNHMGIEITGPLAVTSSGYDHSIKPWPYNPTLAQQLLTEEGWIDHDGDGIRDKLIDGKYVPFSFTLTYYSKNIIARVISEYISTSLREVGVQCNINGVDITDLSHIFEDKSFDAVYFGWSAGAPPDDPRQIWHSSIAREKGSSNAIGYANPEVDRIIEELEYEDNLEKRVMLYHKFHRIIHEEAPYTFLFSPKRQLLYRERVKNLFIPTDCPELIPGAVVSEPYTASIWLRN